jgi:hypothetical protein
VKVVGLYYNVLYSSDIYLQSIPFKNAVDVASNGEHFTLANAANLNFKKLQKKNHKRTYGSGILITKLYFNDAFDTKTR